MLSSTSLRIIFYRSSEGGKQDNGKHFLQVILTEIHQQERPQNIQDFDACCTNELSEGLMLTNYGFLVLATELHFLLFPSYSRCPFFLFSTHRPLLSFIRLFYRRRAH